MKQLFIFASLFTTSLLVACPTNVTNDFNVRIGLASKDLGPTAPAQELTRVVAPAESGKPGETKDVTPDEHSFFVYVEDGNQFKKQFEVVFNFCTGKHENMSYRNIENGDIVNNNDIKNGGWEKGKFAVLDANQKELHGRDVFLHGQESK